MLRIMLISFLMIGSAFAQTECYFDNTFQDGTRGFILEDQQITLIHPYNKFTVVHRSGQDLVIRNEVVGELKLFPPRGIITLGDELSSFKCTVWRTGGRG